MTGNSTMNLISKQVVYACIDRGCASPATETQMEAELGLFAQQTGQLLFTLGSVFIGMEPFNQVISRSTGERLISIGRKLKAAHQ